MVTVATKSSLSGLKSECLACIDISSLSQSELHALSLCSDTAFDLHCTDDLVVPQIDRSVFNESAGSRRQTYSRIRLRSATPGHHRLRLPGLLPSLKPPPSIDPENKSIVNYLKQLLHQSHNSSSTTQPPSQQLVLSGDPVAVSEIVHNDVDRFAASVSNVQEMAIVLHSSERKRKRGRKPKTNQLRDNGIGIELDIVNRNGVIVDLAALGTADDLYSHELRRRTVGLESEEEVLGFLRGLEGQWGSRRKKRKLVDASEFGDSLPIGWKLLLGLRRRDGRVSAYCRRYISPSGQQFVSCREASSYLQSYFGIKGANQPMDRNTGGIQLADGVASINDVQQQAGFIHNTDSVKHDMIPNSTLPGSSTDAHDKEISLMGIDNLPEVQVQDLFECYKCRMTFDEKNAYLQHLLSIHQRTTRRYRLGTSVGEGVIIKDGKYECQFCHKVFEERRSYNGHVGIHVRNYVRGSEESPALLDVKTIEPQSQDVLAPNISKMDALIEVAQSSILETSGAGLNYKHTCGSSPNRFNAKENAAANSDHDLSLGSHPSEMENCMVDRALDQELIQSDSEYTVTDEKTVKIEGDSDVENNANVVCSSTIKHASLDEENRHENSELETGLGNSNDKPKHDAVMDIIEQTVEENALRNGITDSPMQLVQPLHCFPVFTPMSNKGEHEYCALDQKLDSVTAFDELRLDEIENLKYSFVNAQVSGSLPEVSMELVNDVAEEVFNSAVGFESGRAMSSMASRHQVSTVCVWCRTEFDHEAVDSEPQSDSIGFMCPTCKANISGHLDGGLSMNCQQF